MKLIYGKSLEYWKENADKDYLRVPISVLKYIAILEELLEKQVVDVIDIKENGESTFWKPTVSLRWNREGENTLILEQEWVGDKGHRDWKEV